MVLTPTTLYALVPAGQDASVLLVGALLYVQLMFVPEQDDA
jgi:hypothetical protein